MTIYTRYGTPVKLLSPITAGGWVKVLRDGIDEREYHISELKADGGLNEIIEANKSLNARREYQQAYRALRRWNKAAYWHGANPRDTVTMFRNIRDAYPRTIFDKALVSLMDSNAYLMYHSDVSSPIIANG